MNNPNTLIPDDRTVAEYLTDMFDASNLRQVEIAETLGYRPNIVTMWKQGRTAFPLYQVKGLADMLGIDPFELHCRCLREYQPRAWLSIEPMYLERLCHTTGPTPSFSGSSAWNATPLG